MRVGGGNPELVLWPPVAKPNEFKSGVGVIVDEIAVGRAVGRPCKNTDAAVVITGGALELLLKDRIDAEIPPQHGGRAS